MYLYFSPYFVSVSEKNKYYLILDTLKVALAKGFTSLQEAGFFCFAIYDGTLKILYISIGKNHNGWFPDRRMNGVYVG